MNRTKNNNTKKNSDLPVYGGPPNGKLKTSNNTKERWYDENGRATKDRHYTDHGNAKRHPVVTHDHDWGGLILKAIGNSGLDMSRPKALQKIALTAGTIYGGYLAVKWVAAIAASPFTGGGSLIVAGVTP